MGRASGKEDREAESGNECRQGGSTEEGRARRAVGRAGQARECARARSVGAGGGRGCLLYVAVGREASVLRGLGVLDQAGLLVLLLLAGDGLAGGDAGGAAALARAAAAARRRAVGVLAARPAAEEEQAGDLEEDAGEGLRARRRGRDERESAAGAARQTGDSPAAAAREEDGRTHADAGAAGERDEEALAERELSERLVEAGERAGLEVVAAAGMVLLRLVLEPCGLVGRPGVLDRGEAGSAVDGALGSGSGDDGGRQGVALEADDAPRGSAVVAGVAQAEVVDVGERSARPAEGRREPALEAAERGRAKAAGLAAAAVAGLLVHGLGGQGHEAAVRANGQGERAEEGGRRSRGGDDGDGW